MPFQHAQLALPGADNPKMQMHQRVRVVDHLVVPGVGAAHLHAQFLAQLTLQRSADIFSGLELATRKLPIARIGFTSRPGGQQKCAIATHQHADRNLHDRAVCAAGSGALRVSGEKWGCHGRRPALKRPETRRPARRNRARTARPRGRCARRAPAPTSAPAHVLLRCGRNPPPRPATTG